MYIDISTSLQENTQSDSGQPAILCVDDDPCILDGLRRQLRKKFRVRTAMGCAEALETLAREGPFGVVISDLQMPGMDGVQFLSRVRELSPRTIRIMLTGRADISTAMAAVNQGNIFRFLVKPCPPIVIEKVLEAAIDQYKLQVSEQQIMRESLLGCVQVLVEVLSFAQPAAFSRTTRVRRHVREIAAAIGVGDSWEMEAAAMLSQIGWVTLPPAILAKATGNQVMNPEELVAFRAQASSAARILEKIPRLGPVARIVEMQHTAFKDLPRQPKLNPLDLAEVGGQVLKAALDFESLRKQGLRHETVLSRMSETSGVYMPEVLAAMAAVAGNLINAEIRSISLAKLAAGMILEEDLQSEHGVLLLAKGEEVTTTFVERLLRSGYGLSLGQTIRIRT
jgi:response regulator RpfG family c-di-GMP phosphodiesterase